MIQKGFLLDSEYESNPVLGVISKGTVFNIRRYLIHGTRRSTEKVLGI